MINCTLSNKQLRILRTKIAKDLLTYVDNKDNFDLKAYLSKLYNQVNTATQNQNLALDYTRVSVPFIKQLLGVDASLENLPDQGLDLKALYDLSKSVSDDKKGFDNIVSYLDVTINPSKNLKEVKDDLETEEQQSEAEKKNESNRATNTVYQVTRKPYNPVSTSIQELLDTANGKASSPRDPRMKLYTTVTKELLRKINFSGSPFNGVEYPKVNGGVFVKMMPYKELAVSDTYPHVQEVIESGVEKDFIIEDYMHAFVYVLTDKSGTPIRFNENAEVSTNGRIVYYNTRYLPKRLSNGKFDVDNVTNTQTPAEVSKNLGITLDEAREYLREGFEQLEKAYKYIKANPGNTVLYAIDGGSMGALVDKNPKYIPYDEKVFEGENISFAFYKKSELRPGTNSGIYATGASSKYPIFIVPNAISEDLAADLAKMLTEDVKKTDGNLMTSKEKVKVLSTYILNSIKDIKYNLEASTGRIIVKLEGEEIKLSSPDAYDTLKEAFLKSPAGFARQAIVSLAAANSNSKVTIVARDYKDAYQLKEVPYTEYLQENTKMNVELDEDGKIKRYNPYFTLVVNDTDMEKLLLDPSNIKERKPQTNEEKIAVLREQEKRELVKAIPNIESYRNADGTIDRTKLSPLELQMYDKIYKQFDDLISPLMGPAKKVAVTPTENKPEEFVNHSGGAYGGDTFWDLVGRQFGVKDHRHYKEKGEKTSQTLANVGVTVTPLSDEQMKFAEEQLNTLFGPDFLKRWTNKKERDLQIRNYYQVANADAVFAVAELNKDGNGVKGGTNTAVQLGIKLNKPTYVWDLKTNNWYAYDVAGVDKDGVSYKSFVPSNTPTLTKNFAGVGSRDIEIYSVPLERDASGKVTKWGTTLDTKKYRGKDVAAAAKNAIREVYEKTFGPLAEIDPIANADSLSAIEQNFKDGDGGRKMRPQFKDKSTMDLILSGDRTRTTRAKTDINRMMKDYGLVDIFDLEGKVIRMTDKTGRQVYVKITNVAPFTQEYQDATWQKEGWEKSVTDKHVGNYPYAIEFEVVKSTQAPAVTTTEELGPETKINIYAGTGENAELSNFADRPFIASAAGLDEKKWPAQGKFKTVEGAYQAQKIMYTSKATKEENKFNLEILDKLRTASGAQAKSLGRKIKGLDGKDWDKDSSTVMKNLLLESFEQNPDALAKLLATGNATLTHTQDKTKWKTEFPKLLMEVRDELRPAQAPAEVKTISEPYGVVVVETNPTDAATEEYIKLIRPQIQKQAYKENVSTTANDMFMYGLRWTRKSGAKAPLVNKSYANGGLPTTDAKAKDGYVYDTVDQNGNPLAPVSDLQPIISEIEKALGIDMSNYDAVIGNIYLPGQRIATHRDTTESLSARKYPVVVYTLGNASGISIYENEKNPGSASFASDKKTTIPTQNGSIYTFGMDGKGRFEMAHDTPSMKRDQKFPPITLPNGDVVENYTITLTFRRAADLEPGIADSPSKSAPSPVQQKANETVSKVEKQQVTRRGRSSADSDILDQLMNDDDFINKNGKNKLGVQNNLKATREQITAALKWYENSPLSKHIPFKVMFNAINTATKNGIARWDVNGITLFKGSDYSDLYHEAWHGFTQMFLTKEERDKLYKEAASKKGSFVAFSGRTVEFSQATEEELEEYLAEDFREYMLGNKKSVSEKTPVKRNIFQKIFDFLMELFGKSTADDVFTNGNNNSYINELYEKLRVGDLNEFTFNQANRVFTTLNKVVETTTPKDTTEPSKLGYEASRLIASTVDSLFSEAIDKLNGNKTKVFTTAAIRTIKGRSTVYKYVLQELTKQLENVYLDRADMEANGLDIQDINYELDTLCYAVKHFGNPDNLANPQGVIKYHMETSKFMEFDDRQIAELNEIDDSKLTIKNEFESKSGNESSAKSLASPILLYTIRSLHAYDKDGSVRTNRLGFPMLMDYNAAWNRIYNITDGAKNIQDVYDMLSSASEDYPMIKQFLQKIGNPSNMETSSQNLWTEITHVLTMKRIPLMALRTEFSTRYEDRIDPETGEQALDSRNKPIRDEVTTIKVTPTRAGGEYSKVGAKWDNLFAVAAPGRYITVGADNVNTLNLKAVVDDFTSLLSKDNLDRVFGFMEAIGMPLEDNASVRKALQKRDNPTFKAIYDLHTTILYGINKYNQDFAGARPIVIKKPSELFKDFNVKTGDYKLDSKLSGIAIKFNTIQNFQLNWSDDFSDTTVSNAEGENQYEKSLRGTLMNQIDSINAADTIVQLTQEGVANAEDLSMNHLAKSRNPFMKSSKFLKRLFNENGRKIVYESQYGDVRRSQIELLNMSGTSVEVTNIRGMINESGIASASADETTKILQDFYMMMLYGVSEAVRHADKSTTYLFRLISTDLREGKNKGKAYKHLIDLESFTKRSSSDAPSAGKIEFIKDLYLHLCAEYERIQKVKDDTVAGNAIVGDSTYGKEGAEFVIFDKILDDATKKKLKAARKASLAQPIVTSEDLQNYLNDPKRVELKNSIENQIGKYLDSQVKEFTTSLNEMGFYNNPKLADQVLTKMGVRSPQSLTEEARAQVLKDMAEAYVANSWLQNLEVVLMFYGDPALYNHAKDEFFKRNAGLGATGAIPRTDKYMQEYINAKLDANSLASKLGFKPKKFGRTMTSAVMQDAKTESVYYKEYLDEAVEFEKERLTKLKASKEQIDKTIKAITERFGEYKKMKEADGQGWINFDAYRALLMSLNKWTSTQESIYNKIVNGEEVTEDILQFFPVKKMQYWGPLKTDGLPVYGFHKYSLMPLIPNLIKGKNLETLQQKMLEQGIDYALLQSGSKINTLTKDGTVDKFYNNSTSNKDKSLAINDEGYEFTPNVIFMDYFKDQLEVHDHFGGKVTFSTQLRKLIEDGLMENGVPTDWKPFDFSDPWERIKAWDEASKEEKATSRNYQKLLRYEANLNALVDLKKQKLTKEIGSDMSSLLKFVKKELTRQEMSDHEIDFIDYDGITKEPKQALDLSLSADKIEKILVAVIQKRLINQKINGESLVQVSGVGFEDANANMRNATEEEIKRYGTNGLTFYRKKADGTTAAMKIKIAMQGNFKKLLYHPDVLAEAKKGFTAVQALNNLIKNEEWLDKPINPNQAIYAKAFAKMDSTKGDTKLFILRSDLTPELEEDLIPDTKDGVRVKGGEYHGIKIIGDFYAYSKAKSRDGENLDVIVVDNKEDAEKQYQAYVEGGAKNFTGISEVEPVDKNRSFITMVAARIPVQGLNSMEFMEVYEFLPEEAGNIVILPAEIVAKSGGDFDIDKMFTMMPNISAKYKSISDKSLNKISEEFGRRVTRDELDELDEKINDIDNEEPFTDEELMLADLVDFYAEEEVSVKLDKSRKSVKGIENALIKDSVGILSMPENRIKLITPNGIDILKGIADEMAFVDRGEMPGTKKSPTEIFELGRNLYKHQSNSIGKAVLGIIAVANTFNTLFARTGLIMSNERVITYKKDGTPVIKPQTLNGMPHNLINGRISLSSAYSQDLSNRVADIINQMINGAVDVAKDAWIFDIQGNKEVIPSLLFMIQAGVPIDYAVYFVSQPIIKDFLAKQRLLKSKFAVPIGQEDVGLFHRIEARNQILFDINSGFTLFPENYINKEVTGNTKVYDKSLVWDLLQESAKDIGQYTKEDLKKNLTEDSTDDELRYTDLDRAVFAQFIMIQEMAGQVTQLTQALKFDNDKTSTLLDARMKLEQMDNLTNGIDEESIRKIAEESPISAFKIQDFILEKYHRLFPLRDNVFVNDMIQEIFRRQGDGKNLSYGIKKITGMDDETLQRTLRNDLMTFLFQRSYYKFNVNAKTYQGSEIEVEIQDLRNLKALARVLDGKLYADRKLIASTFDSGAYTRETAWEYGAPVDAVVFGMYDKITGKELYTKFIFEREMLRSYPENSKENISKTKDYLDYLKQFNANPSDKYPSENKAYEAVLRDKALDNLNLHGHLFYGDKAYGRRIMQLKETNPDLFQKYAVLSNLEAITKPYASTTLTNLKFANTLYTADDLNTYHSNLQDLANPSVIKSEDPEENKRISELFKKFGIFSILQSGTDVKSTLSMVRAVPTEMYVPLFELAYKEFTEEMPVEQALNLLKNYQDTFVNHQYTRTNFLSKKIKNWATDPFRKEAEEEFIYNLDPDALAKKLAADAAAQQEMEEGAANVLNIGGVNVNLSKLGISFKPNAQQIEALNKMADFISKGYDENAKGDYDNMYSLMGYAGTGKTSITKILLAYLENRNITTNLTATTHKAKGVLGKVVNKGTNTIHKALGLAPNINPFELDLAKLELYKAKDREKNPADAIIIDESSFIGPELFEFIMQHSHMNQQQVIFIGDPGQLKPVRVQKPGERFKSIEDENVVEYEDTISPVFRLVDNRSELTQVERQAGDNPLGPILDGIREDLNSKVRTFKNKSDIIGNQGIVFTNSRENFSKKLAEAFGSENFRQNRNFVRAVSWTNARADELNKEIRNALGYTDPYVVGDVIIGKTNFGNAINNSMDYVVTAVEYVPSKLLAEEVIKRAGVNLTPVDVSGYNITIQDIFDPKKEPSTIFVLSEDTPMDVLLEIGRQGAEIKKLGALDRKLFVHHYKFQESFASIKKVKDAKGNEVIRQTFSYGYAHTVHKSQGSTYTNIFVDLVDISKNRQDDERNRLEYVGLSRATNIAYSYVNDVENETPNLEWDSDFEVKEIVPQDVTMPYKEEKDIASSTRFAIVEDKVSKVRMFRYTLKKDSGLPGAGVLTEETATMVKNDYPNGLFVFNNFSNLKGSDAGSNSVWRALGSNGIGIVTKKGAYPTKPDSDKVNMADALTDDTLEDNKRIIDEAIASIKQRLSEPGPKKYLVFDEYGYGQYMIGYVENAPLISRPTLKPVAPQTFLYLSEQLYRNFGYINPHYLLIKQGRQTVQQGQPITDDEVIEQNKKC